MSESKIVISPMSSFARSHSALQPQGFTASLRPLQPKSRSNYSRKKKQGKNRIQEEKIGVKKAIIVVLKAGEKTGMDQS
ncbi:hypothetical protein D478_03659 [Brevibacillus agri BAB-2500]|nr:hypothetical protein D478_03659 [Brevibacillus agri BAB-2500]